MIWVTLGWAVWGSLALYTIVLWVSAFRHPNGGVRILALTCAFLFSLALALTAAPGFPKLHLVWAAPAIYFGSMTMAGNLIDSRIKTAPERAEEESKRTGEPVAAILDREYKKLGFGPEPSEVPAPVGPEQVPQ